MRILLALAVFSVLVMHSLAQAPPQSNGAGTVVEPAPRWPDGHVNLGSTADQKGYWEVRPGLGGMPRAADVPFQPWARALYQYRSSRTDLYPPLVSCKPATGPSFFNAPGFEIVEAPELKSIFILNIAGPHSWRVIYMDGRPHPIFFFKQKTAYEIGLGIPAEPLFRSTNNLFNNLIQRNQSAAFSSGKVRPNHETNINIIARRTGKDVNSHTVLDGIITTIMATIQRINIIGSREGSRNRRRLKANQTGKKFRVGIKSNISTNRNNLISGVDRCIHLNAMKKTTITSINRQTIKI